MKVFTSRYLNTDEIAESGLRPVGITAGSPRFLKLPYRPELVYVRELAPDRGVMFEETDRARFTPLYKAKLGSVGIDFVRAKLEAVATDSGVVYLCFEDVLPDEWCHRLVFAEWWEEQTGQLVEELSEAT